MRLLPAARLRRVFFFLKWGAPFLAWPHEGTVNYRRKRRGRGFGLVIGGVLYKNRDTSVIM
jgi:hypothetical protein